jgi:hypothetical protein
MSDGACHPNSGHGYMKICRRRSSPIMDYGEQSADFIKQSQSRKEFFLTRLRFVLDRFLSYRSHCVVERPVYRIVGRTIKRALKWITWSYLSERVQIVACFALYFVVALGSYLCDVLQLVFLLMTISSSPKMDFAWNTCGVSDIGVFTGSSC